MSEQDPNTMPQSQSNDDQELFHSEGKQATTEVASRLRTIADKLEQGSMMLGDQQVTVPENVVLKIELEEQHDGDIAPINFEIEVEIMWPVRMQDD